MGSKIAYYNFLQYAALTVTSQATGFPKANLQDFRDYTYWKATGTGDQTIEIDLNGSGYEASYVGYIGFVGHNLKTADAAIQLQKWNGTEWEVVLSDFAAPHDHAFFKTFTADTAAKWRVILSSLAAAPQIGHIGLGQICEFDYLPDAPFNLGGERVIATQEISNSGNLLGVVTDYAEVELSSTWSPVSTTELGAVEAFWDNHARFGRPFFYAPDGDTDGNYVYWAHIPADSLELQKPRSTSVYIDSISLTMRGHR